MFKYKQKEGCGTYYENELSFLCDTFRKSRVRISLVTENDSLSLLHGDAWHGENAAPPADKNLVRRFLSGLRPRTVYRSTDAFCFRYTYFLLPSAAEPTLLLCGPYLKRPLTAEEILEIGERNGVPPKSQKYLTEYYFGVPVLPEDSPLTVMLGSFCERIFESPSFAIVDVGEEHAIPASPLHRGDVQEELREGLIDMKTMEKRYAYENELIEAVRLGQIHKESLLFTLFSEEHFEKRARDRLQNAKNYAIIMNTLLRKAAEQGGVHPLYIDRVSSAFAHEIERLPDARAAGELMREIFRSYCRLVRKNATQTLSRVVEEARILVDSDLSAELSPSLIAKTLGVSAGYLSTVFRREMGKTLSEYIREKRMKHASHLLATTSLQVQTVAQHCGILDMQYFSKLFKRETGKTPKEYRDTAKKQKEHTKEIRE